MGWGDTATAHDVSRVEKGVGVTVIACVNTIKIHDSCRLKAGGWRLEAVGWRLEAGGWRLEAGGWRLEAGG